MWTLRRLSMKIIEKHNRLTCPSCGSILEYEKSDVKTKLRVGHFYMTRYVRYVLCPICKEDIEF